MIPSWSCGSMITLSISKMLPLGLQDYVKYHQDHPSCSYRLGAPAWASSHVIETSRSRMILSWSDGSVVTLSVTEMLPLGLQEYVKYHQDHPSCSYQLDAPAWASLHVIERSRSRLILSWSDGSVVTLSVTKNVAVRVTRL